MTPLDRIHALAALLWPDYACDLVVRPCGDGAAAAIYDSDGGDDAEALARVEARSATLALEGLDRDLVARGRTLAASLAGALGDDDRCAQWREAVCRVACRDRIDHAAMVAAGLGPVAAVDRLVASLMGQLTEAERRLGAQIVATALSAEAPQPVEREAEVTRVVVCTGRIVDAHRRYARIVADTSSVDVYPFGADGCPALDGCGGRQARVVVELLPADDAPSGAP